MSLERFVSGGGRQDGEDKTAHLDDEFLQVALILGEATPAHECPPLNSSRWIGAEGVHGQAAQKAFMARLDKAVNKR